ncbi:hypothetical protein [uncultured Roseobacter sp.]|uniref:hypothetical protein n=1 Tax=uncultured Roseobacter sp. TaxID=114847 RepID=UPI00263692C7|nr:hypothetical protein [uncultured Roseobacter sp.]
MKRTKTSQSGPSDTVANKTAATPTAAEDTATDMPLASLNTILPIFGGDDDLLQPIKSCIHFRPLRQSCLAPVTVGDLLVVEQNLCGYKMGEIAQIENVMARERREFSSRDLNSITDTTESSFEREVEETQTSGFEERFSLSVQSQEAQSQQTSVSGNISASYNAPAFSATIGANASYTSSKDASLTTSQEYAKTVTEEATKRVREAVSESKKVTIVTESVKTTLQGFDNTESDTHITGIYRWIDKYYNAQLFDYGKRLFLQFHVPEPAFFLRDLAKLIDRQELADIDPPTHPRDLSPPIKSYEDVTEANYASLAATYDATDIAPPPPLTLVKGKGISHPEADPGTSDNGVQDHNEPTLAKTIDTVIVDQGYHLVEWQANIPMTQIGRPDKNGTNTDVKYGYYTTIGFSDTSSDVNMLLVNVMGVTCYYLTHNDGADNDKDIMVSTNRFDEWHASPDPLEGEIPITIGAEFEGKFYFNLLYKMERNDETLQQWQIDTYAKILQAYTNKQTAYEQDLQQAETSRDSQVGALKAQPREETYRRIEAEELRKHCIDILTRHTAFAEQPRKLNELPDGRMEINLSGLFGIPNWQANNVNGVTAAFAEEAFEWEMITYKLYPYFWTDRQRWDELFREEETGDALFDQFLKSGFARVVVPLRPNYERSVLYFLRTNMIWAGGEVPAFDDDTHLSLLEELHDSVQIGKGDGMPVDAPWEVKVPTSFVYLQEGSDLPEFDCSFGADTDGAVELPSEEEIEEQETAMAALMTSTEKAGADG